MPHFIVTTSPSDDPGWGLHRNTYIVYLRSLIAAGSLIASGSLKNTERRSDLLIFCADNRAKVETTIAEDPFAQKRLIKTLHIIKWDSLFGTFARWSTGVMPGGITLAQEAVP